MTLALLAQAANSPSTGFAISGGLIIVFIIIALVASIFWLWMLIDCLTSPMPTGEKALWAVVIIFLHLLGALIYYFVGRRGRGTHVTT